MKPGRNDPCPCGSGRKYKQCCLAKAQAESESPGQLTWRRIRRANEDLIPRMLRFVTQAYGEGAVEEAWDEFTLWDEDVQADEEYDWYNSPHQSVFLPWLLHRWAPDPYDDTVVVNEKLHNVPPTRAFLQHHARHLEPITQRYLEACLVAPFTFYEIVDVEPNHSFRARELICGREYSVLERSATQDMERGHILFGALVQVDGIVMLEACAPVVIQPKHKQPVIEARGKILRPGDPLSDEFLIEWDIELRMLYLDLAKEILDPPLPELCNTDGDPMSLQRLVFDIDSPQEAFDALKHLALDTPVEGLLDVAKRASDGALLQIELPWLGPGNKIHKHWNNTTLGHIEIDGTRLSVAVNSQQRADEFRRIAAEALGPQVRYRVTEMQSVEKALAESEQGGNAVSDERDDLASLPVQSALQDMMSQHYADWVSQKLPALQGETPLEAVRNAEGHEIVEELVRQIELDGRRMTPPLDEAITRQLRERLGLGPA
jgi:hypothetical protein